MHICDWTVRRRQRKGLKVVSPLEHKLIIHVGPSIPGNYSSGFYFNGGYYGGLQVKELVDIIEAAESTIRTQVKSLSAHPFYEVTGDRAFCRSRFSFMRVLSWLGSLFSSNILWTIRPSHNHLIEFWSSCNQYNPIHEPSAFLTTA